MVFHEGAADLYGLADGAELAGAIACHEERIRIVVLVSGRCADSCEQGSGKNQ